LRTIGVWTAILVGLFVILSIVAAIFAPEGAFEEPHANGTAAEAQQDVAPPEPVELPVPSAPPSPRAPVPETHGNEDLLPGVQSLLRAGQLWEASDVAQRVAQTRGDDPEVESILLQLSKVFLERAWNLKSEGEYVEAYHCAREARSLSPTNPETHWVVGWLAAEETVNDLDEGIRAFRRFQELSSEQDRIAEAERAIDRLQERR
jgi:hypothetical protein